jgi:hypothetical protein
MHHHVEQIQDGITPPGFGAKSRGFSAIEVDIFSGYKKNGVCNE